jgi:hypothetical protein
MKALRRPPINPQTKAGQEIEPLSRGFGKMCRAINSPLKWQSSQYKRPCQLASAKLCEGDDDFNEGRLGAVFSDLKLLTCLLKIRRPRRGM